MNALDSEIALSVYIELDRAVDAADASSILGGAMTITEEELAAIEQRAKETDARWCATPHAITKYTDANMVNAVRYDVPKLVADLRAERAANARLREALRELADYPLNDDPRRASSIARAALAEDGG